MLMGGKDMTVTWDNARKCVTSKVGFLFLIWIQNNEQILS